MILNRCCILPDEQNCDPNLCAYVCSVLNLEYCSDNCDVVKGNTSFFISFNEEGFINGIDSNFTFYWFEDEFHKDDVDLERLKDLVYFWVTITDFTLFGYDFATMPGTLEGFVNMVEIAIENIEEGNVQIW